MTTQQAKIPRGRSKLTVLEADLIRLEYLTKKTPQRTLAARHGVSQMAIWQVISGRTFRPDRKGAA